MNQFSHEQLMVAYVGGDPKAFENLYRLTSPQIFSYLLRLTRDRSRADDLLQVTFTKLYRARATYTVGAPFMPWVMAIARRSFLDERRSAKSRNETLSPDGNLPEPAQHEAPANQESRDLLDRALDELPEAYREAIQLTKIVGLSLAEASEVLETTPTAVKLRVHRGYNLLRDRLANLQQGPQ